ncbi:hypothetical protein C0992_000487 [Termitomyces sp. T32_za158]|nr:hypothetical protein C0992_000487 [Termitomyces sp. T32_za158]
MAQTNVTSTPISVAQLVAALQQLGITISTDTDTTTELKLATSNTSSAAGNTDNGVAGQGAGQQTIPEGNIPHVCSVCAASGTPSPNTGSNTVSTVAPANASAASSNAGLRRHSTAIPTNINQGTLANPTNVASTANPAINIAPAGSVASSDAWYAVTIGRSVGVFCGWHNVGPLVHGISGFCCKHYKTRDAALAAFNDALNKGLVEVKQ